MNNTSPVDDKEKSSPASPETGEEWVKVPPDGGWGWLVLGGTLLINMLIPGTIKSFGVLFVEFIEVFQTTQLVASWIPALCYFLYCSIGPLTTYLSIKFSYRSVTIAGGLSAAFGMILSCFATSIVYLYFRFCSRLRFATVNKIVVLLPWQCWLSSSLCHHYLGPV